MNVWSLRIIVALNSLSVLSMMTFSSLMSSQCVYTDIVSVLSFWNQLYLHVRKTNHFVDVTSLNLTRVHCKKPILAIVYSGGGGCVHAVNRDHVGHG